MKHELTRTEQNPPAPQQKLPRKQSGLGIIQNHAKINQNQLVSVCVRSLTCQSCVDLNSFTFAQGHHLLSAGEVEPTTNLSKKGSLTGLEGVAGKEQDDLF